jgi:type III restriction enzyme
MKLRLLDFQRVKAAELVKKVESAQLLLHADFKQPQAVILTSPTGSGKTAMMAAALEAIVEGDEEHLPNPRATILWISDSPELNAQSKQKFADYSEVFTSGRLETVETEFDRPILDPGRIYFINTQKFSATSTLTRPPADGRKHTIWQTIANTIKERGADFLLIIDEAHRGMLAGGTQRDYAEAQTIVQKFLLGSEGQIPEVPLIIGISATPKRFSEILEASYRTAHKVIIDPAVVRTSGLLKHRLLIHNPEGRQRHADDSLLREAIKHHTSTKQAWEVYCTTAKEKPVRPLLVIQVEDGATGQELFSRTDIDQVIRSIREEMPAVSPDNICHCFQDEGSLKADGIRIRKVDPSKLQEDTFAEIVLFKTALTTGWDCPRAETMMSYRTARDATMIEQLVGRMIRAPLARSIESNDTLNTVRLFLPGFDRPAVQNIIKKLADPDNQDSVPTEIQDATDYISYPRWEAAASAFEAHPSLPTCRVPRTSQQPALVRLLKLATRLSVSTRIQENAKEKVTEEILAILINESAQRKGNPGFEATVAHAKEIRIEGHLFDVLANRYRMHGADIIAASDENVDQIFRAD